MTISTKNSVKKVLSVCMGFAMACALLALPISATPAFAKGPADTPCVSSYQVHILSSIEGKAATCERSGVMAHEKCDVCGKMFVGRTQIDDPIIYSTGHSYYSVPTKPATYDQPGVLKHDACYFCDKMFIGSYVVFPEDIALPKLQRPAAQTSAQANTRPASAPATNNNAAPAAAQAPENDAVTTEATEAANAETVTIEDNDTPLGRRASRVTIEDEPVPLAQSPLEAMVNWIPAMIGAIILITGILVFLIYRLRKSEQA